MPLRTAQPHDELFQATVAFARSSLQCDMVPLDRAETFNTDGWKQCAQFGLLGMPVPEEYGGLGLGISEVITVMEGLGYASSDQGLLFSINAHLWTNTLPILQYGTEEQKKRYLPRLANGELIGANAATEPDAGSDIFSMRTRAERRGDRYILNGSKTYVTNAPIASLIVVYATLDPALGPMGITAFLVDSDTPGITLGKSLDKMGLRTSPMAEIFLENCEVPVDRRLGREGRGVAVFESSMEWERGCILANCLGIMRRQFEQCVRYAQTRKQFGKPIGKYQSVANRIVDMKLRLDTCRPLVYRIGELKQQGKPAQMEAALAKLHVSECYVKSSLDTVQIHGGYGYMTESGIERELRDAVASTLYSGTSEIQRNIIAKCLGL